MSDLDLLHRKIRLLEKWMLLVDERLLKLERAKTYYPMTEEYNGKIDIKIGGTD